MCRDSIEGHSNPLCVSSGPVWFESCCPEPYVSVQYMDRDLSPPGSPLMVLLQGLSELHCSACVLCVCSPVIPRLFAVTFTCLPKSRPGGEVQGTRSCGVPEKTNSGEYKARVVETFDTLTFCDNMAYIAKSPYNPETSFVPVKKLYMKCSVLSGKMNISFFSV